MAASRPKIKVIQQLETVSTTADVPDLNVLIVGPAYHIQDYTSLNKANIKHSVDYGSLTAPSGATGEPDPSPAAIVISDPINNSLGAVLDSDSVVIYLDDVLVLIENGGDGAFTPNTNVLTSAGSDFVTTGVKAGDRVVITDNAGTPADVTVVRLVKSVTDANTLVLTRNLTTSGAAGINGDINGDAYTTLNGSGLYFRVERELQDKALAGSFVTVAGQETTIADALTVSDTEEDLTNAVVTYAKVYQQYRSLRQDLEGLDTVENQAELTAKLGTIDERNPLAVGVFIASQRTNSPVQFYGVTGDNLNDAADTLAAHTSCKDALESRKDIYCIVPLSTSNSVISMWKDSVVALAEADHSNFRIVIGSSVLPTTSVVSAASPTGDVEVVTGDPVVVFVDPDADYVAANVAAGDALSVTNTVLSGSYEVRRVLAPTFLEVIAVDEFPATGLTSGVDYTVDGIKVIRSSADVTTRERHSVILDSDAQFITDGVRVGDLLEIPANGGSDFTTTLDTFTIASIISENRIKIDLGDSAVLPLPYLNDGVDPATAIDYRVSRAMTKADQVLALNATTASLKTPRLTMVWPDECMVADVINNSTGVQTAQPGYYLACALGGMVAGTQPHQNFTNIGVGGVDSVTNSSGYFTDAQIDALSSGGWYVFLQDTPNALPYSVHALTTDTTTLESGELMVVKNFDFVSIFFKNLLTQFLSGWNVLPETLNMIRLTLESGSAQLQARKTPKIGAPLLSSNIATIQTVSGSADQVEVFMTVQLPRPLNEIGLYLTA